MSYLRKMAYAIRHPDYALNRIIGLLRAWTGYDGTQWARVVMYRELFERVRALGPAAMSALEISPAGPDSPWRGLGFAAYEGVEHPEFDICRDRLERQFDLVIADQVFEHLLWPYRAARNVHSMLNSGGRFIVTTPFLIRVHDVPIDCSRWTELGLKHLLAEGGFDIDRIKTGSWGNLACVRANLKTPSWASVGFGRPLHNEHEYPVAVWAIAEK